MRTRLAREPSTRGGAQAIMVRNLVVILQVLLGGSGLSGVALSKVYFKKTLLQGGGRMDSPDSLFIL